jgi:hypothetical protein
MTLFRASLLALAASAAFLSGPVSAQDLSAEERLSIISDCTRLEHDFAYTLDDNNAEGFANLWSETGTMKVIRGTYTGGVAGMRDYMKQRAANQAKAGGYRTTHVMSNIEITIKDRDNASGHLYETMYRYNDAKPESIKSLAPALIGIVKVDYVRTAEGWRMHKRELEAVSAQP